MTHSREASLVNRISLLARGARDLREKRDGSDVSSSRVAPVGHVLLVSLTIHERRFTCKSSGSGGHVNRWVNGIRRLPPAE